MANLQKVQATYRIMTLKVDKVLFLICNLVIVVCEMISRIFLMFDFTFWKADFKLPDVFFGTVAEIPLHSAVFLLK